VLSFRRAERLAPIRVTMADVRPVWPALVEPNYA